MDRILVIDDDPEFLEMMDVFLTRTHHIVRTLSHSENVLKEIEEFEPNLVICDILMPVMSGGKVYELIRKHKGEKFPVVLCSATNMRLRITDDPFLAYCRKPINFEDLNYTLQILLTSVQPTVKEPIE